MSILPQAFVKKLIQQMHALAGAALPGSCLLCGADSGAMLICPSCQHDLPTLGPQCPQCALPTSLGERCGSCLVSPPPFVATRAAFAYDFPVDRIVQAFKYRHCLPVARWAARCLAERCTDLAIDCIVPLPLHPDRLRERGFNQSAEIAMHLRTLLNRPVIQDALTRPQAGPPQATRSLKERHQLKGAFAGSDRIARQRVLLIDDVLTTGATASDAARTLLKHGATSITLGVLARATRHESVV